MLLYVRCFSVNNGYIIECLRLLTTLNVVYFHKWQWLKPTKTGPLDSVHNPKWIEHLLQEMSFIKNCCCATHKMKWKTIAFYS